MLRLQTGPADGQVALIPYEGPECGLGFDFGPVDDASFAAVPLAACFESSMGQQLHAHFQQLLAQLQPSPTVLAAVAAAQLAITNEQHSTDSATAPVPDAGQGQVRWSAHETATETEPTASGNISVQPATQGDTPDVKKDTYNTQAAETKPQSTCALEPQHAAPQQRAADSTLGWDSFGPDAYPSMIPETCMEFDDQQLIVSGAAELAPRATDNVLQAVQQQQHEQCDLEQQHMQHPQQDRERHQQHQQQVLLPPADVDEHNHITAMSKTLQVQQQRQLCSAEHAAGTVLPVLQDKSNFSDVQLTNKQQQQAVEYKPTNSAHRLAVLPVQTAHVQQQQLEQQQQQLGLQQQPEELQQQCQPQPVLCNGTNNAHQLRPLPLQPAQAHQLQLQQLRTEPVASKDTNSAQQYGVLPMQPGCAQQQLQRQPLAAQLQGQPVATNINAEQAAPQQKQLLDKTGSKGHSNHAGILYQQIASVPSRQAGSAAAAASTLKPLLGGLPVVQQQAAGNNSAATSNRKQMQQQWHSKQQLPGLIPQQQQQLQQNAAGTGLGKPVLWSPQQQQQLAAPHHQWQQQPPLFLPIAISKKSATLAGRQATTFNRPRFVKPGAATAIAAAAPPDATARAVNAQLQSERHVTKGLRPEPGGFKAPHKRSAADALAGPVSSYAAAAVKAHEAEWIDVGQQQAAEGVQPEAPVAAAQGAGMLFSTARGSKVHLSDAALAKARNIKLFDDDEAGLAAAPEAAGIARVSSSDVVGLCMLESGHNLQAYDYRLAAVVPCAEVTLEGAAAAAADTSEVPRVVSFSTARGAKVQISDAALAKADALLTRLDIDGLDVVAAAAAADGVEPVNPAAPAAAHAITDRATAWKPDASMLKPRAEAAAAAAGRQQLPYTAACARDVMQGHNSTNSAAAAAVPAGSASAPLFATAGGRSIQLSEAGQARARNMRLFEEDDSNADGSTDITAAAGAAVPAPDEMRPRLAAGHTVATKSFTGLQKSANHLPGFFKGFSVQQGGCNAPSASAAAAVGRFQMSNLASYSGGSRKGAFKAPRPCAPTAAAAMHHNGTLGQQQQQPQQADAMGEDTQGTGIGSDELASIDRIIVAAEEQYAAAIQANQATTTAAATAEHAAAEGNTAHTVTVAHDVTTSGAERYAAGDAPVAAGGTALVMERHGLAVTLSHPADAPPVCAHARAEGAGLAQALPQYAAHNSTIETAQMQQQQQLHSVAQHGLAPVQLTGQQTAVAPQAAPDSLVSLEGLSVAAYAPASAGVGATGAPTSADMPQSGWERAASCGDYEEKQAAATAAVVLALAASEAAGAAPSNKWAAACAAFNQGLADPTQCTVEPSSNYEPSLLASPVDQPEAGSNTQHHHEATMAPAAASGDPVAAAAAAAVAMADVSNAQLPCEDAGADVLAGAAANGTIACDAAGTLLRSINCGSASSTEHDQTGTDLQAAADVDDVIMDVLPNGEQQQQPSALLAAEHQQQQQHDTQLIIAANARAAAAAAAARSRQTLCGTPLPVNVQAARSGLNLHVPCSYHNMMWASGDGVMLLHQSQQYGATFADHLRQLGLLPPAAPGAGATAAAAGSFDHCATTYVGCSCLWQPLLVELVVDELGSVELVIELNVQPHSQGAEPSTRAASDALFKLPVRHSRGQTAAAAGAAGTAAGAAQSNDEVIIISADASPRAASPSATAIDHVHNIPAAGIAAATDAVQEASGPMETELATMAATMMAATATTMPGSLAAAGDDVVPATPLLPTAVAVATARQQQQPQQPVSNASVEMDVTDHTGADGIDPAATLAVDNATADCDAGVAEAAAGTVAVTVQATMQTAEADVSQPMTAGVDDATAVDATAAADGAACAANNDTMPTGTCILNPAAAAVDPCSTLPVRDLFGAALPTPAAATIVAATPTPAAAAAGDAEVEDTLPVADLFGAAVDTPPAASTAAGKHAASAAATGRHAAASAMAEATSAAAEVVDGTVSIPADDNAAEAGAAAASCGAVATMPVLESHVDAATATLQLQPYAAAVDPAVTGMAAANAVVGLPTASDMPVQVDTAAQWAVSPRMGMIQPAGHQPPQYSPAVKANSRKRTQRLSGSASENKSNAAAGTASSTQNDDASACRPCKRRTCSSNDLQSVDPQTAHIQQEHSQQQQAEAVPQFEPSVLFTAAGKTVQPASPVKVALFRQMMGLPPAEQQQQQQQQQQSQQSLESAGVADAALTAAGAAAEADAGRDTDVNDERPAKRRSCSPANLGEQQQLVAPQHQQRQQEQLSMAALGGCGLATASGKTVDRSTAAEEAFRQKIGWSVAAEQQREVQQQQHGLDSGATAAVDTRKRSRATMSLFSCLEARDAQDNTCAAAGSTHCGSTTVQMEGAVQPPQATAAAAAIDPGSCTGLCTASGRKVAASADSVAAFQQLMGQGRAVKQRGQHAVAPAQEAAAAAEDSDLVAQCQAGMGPAEPPAALPVGLCTASGKKVAPSAQSLAALKQLLGHNDSGQQGRQAPAPLHDTSAVAVVPAAASVGSGTSGLLTAGGRRIKPSAEALAAFQQLMGHSSNVAQQVRQESGPVQEPPPAAAAPSASNGAVGLSTAGGRHIAPSAESVAAFQQLMGHSSKPRQQNQQEAPSAAATPNPVTADPLCASSGTNSKQTATAQQGVRIASSVEARMHQRELPLPSAMQQQRLGAAPVVASPATVVARPMAAPAAAPTLAIRKRPLRQQQNPLLADQQLSRSGKKAFKAPAVCLGRSTRSTSAAAAGSAQQSKTQHRQQQANQQDGGAPISADKADQRQQQQGQQSTKGQQLSVAQYFALARAQKSAAATATGATTATALASAAAARLAAEVAAADSNAASELVNALWVVPKLPVTPDDAAAFAFSAVAATAVTAAAAAGESSMTARQQQAPSNPPSASSSSGAAGGNSSSTSSTFGIVEARQQLIAWGADPNKATAAWVANHYKWIVWKLASYDRKLMTEPSSSSNTDGWHLCRGAASPEPAACCLSVRSLMQQLQHRYTAEMRDGQRSVLKKTLEQDLPSGVPLVLMVSAIRASRPNQQQQGQGQQGRGQSPDPMDSDAVQSLQLSDGWYYVNAQPDRPLKELIAQGRIQVGVKLRVVGAQLRSDRPADPLEAARWAILTLNYNMVSPAAWDAKLGPVPTGQTLRALSFVHPAGGLVPRLLLVVQRSYPLQYYRRNCRTQKPQYYTAKALAAMQRKAERHQEQLQQAAATATRSAEIQQCKEWASSDSASVVEKAYAAVILGGGEDNMGLNSKHTVSPGQLQGFRVERESIMERWRQQHMQQLAAEATAAAAASGDAAAADVDLSLDLPQPIKRFRVTGVLSKAVLSSNSNLSLEGGSAARSRSSYGQAIIKAWRAGEAVQQLDEGSVVLASGLTAGTNDRSSTVNLHGVDGCNMLELSTTNCTSWHVLGGAAQITSSLADLDLGPHWQPRSYTKLHQLNMSMVQAEFDFAGVLLWAGEVISGSREHHQWVFLAGDTQQQQSQHKVAVNADDLAQPGGSVAAAPPPAVLAVRLFGSSLTCVDWLEPSQAKTAATAGCQQQQLLATPTATLPAQAAASALNASGSTVSKGRYTGAKRIVAQQQQNKTQCKEAFACCSNLVLTSFDHTNNMWVAAAPDTAEISVVVGTSKANSGRAAVAVQEVRKWANEQIQHIGALKHRMQQLVGGVVN